MNNGVTATLSFVVPAGTASGNSVGIVLYSYAAVGSTETNLFGSAAMAAVYVQ
jgi:hypothetical protein